MVRESYNRLMEFSWLLGSYKDLRHKLSPVHTKKIQPFSSVIERYRSELGAKTLVISVALR